MINLTGYETFCLYLALKNHFTRDNYDFFKYHGKTHVTKESFINRRDRFQFQRLSRKYNADQMKDFLIANFLHDATIWVGQLLEEDAEERYNEYMKRKQSLSYTFNNELERLIEIAGELKALFKMNDNTLPLLTLHFQNEASLETLALLDHFVDYFNKFDNQMKDDYIWGKIRMKCKKLLPFMEFDRSKMKGILKDKMQHIMENTNG